MSIAVLPFNAGPNTRPTIARQMANFAAEIVRNQTNKPIHSVNYLIQIDQQGGQRLANVNPAESLNELEMVQQLFQQAEGDVSLAMDGLLVEADGTFNLTLRVFQKGDETPVNEEQFNFTDKEFFTPMRAIIEELAARSEAVLPAETQKDEVLFGTDKPEAFVKFIEGYDALQYIEKTQGRVVVEFDPKFAFDSLIEAMKIDPDWEGPEIMLLQLARACVNLRLGNAEGIEAALNEMIAIRPKDGRPHIVLGELYQGVGDLQRAMTSLEKAQELDPSEPALYTRMGIVQGQMNMPANAEQSFRKAMELEGPDKPSAGFLSQVLTQSNRAHEVPGIWKEILDNNPKNSHAWANYGASLMQAGQNAEGLRAFDEGMEKADEPNIVKRMYAPALASVQEWDKAMDFFEDCIDETPTDIQLLWQYAQTLQGAGRAFEVPKILRDILGSNPDPNTRANTLAWLVELEQPKRVESVAQAEEKMKAEDHVSAVKILRPMRNWLADYWKMWALYAQALNHTGEHREAEEASGKLIELYPGLDLGFIELGNALMAQEKFDEAFNAMSYAMNTIQGSLGVAVQFGLAAKRSGKPEIAQNLAQQIRQAIGQNDELEPVLKEMES